MNGFACCLMTCVALLGQPPDGGTRVAVVNIPKVSEQYKKTSDLEAQFDGVRRRLSEQRDGLRNRIDVLTRSLKEELRPNTDEFRARQKELAVAQAELEWFMDTESKRVELGLSNSLREIFDDILRTVSVVAEARGYDIVLASDQLPEEPAESATQVRQQILLQKVLYWNPRVDITEEIISRLNADYDAKSGKTNGADRQTSPK